MPVIKENYSLKKHNTFGLDAKAKYFATFNSEEALADLLKSEITQKEPLFILGGGSNILLTKNFLDCREFVLKKIALLGGTHFIGYHLLRNLFSRGYQITIFNRGITQPPTPLSEEVEVVIGNRNNPKDFQKLFCKRDYFKNFEFNQFSIFYFDNYNINP